MDVILLLRAESDIQTAFNRYEDHQAGRGEVFIRQLDAALTLLQRQPNLGSRYGKLYRRILIPDFPYGVFYSEQPVRLIIAAVMDLRQDPENIRRRLNESDETDEG